MEELDDEVNGAIQYVDEIKITCFCIRTFLETQKQDEEGGTSPRSTIQTSRIPMMKLPNLELKTSVKIISKWQNLWS